MNAGDRVCQLWRGILWAFASVVVVMWANSASALDDFLRDDGRRDLGPVQEAATDFGCGPCAGHDSNALWTRPTLTGDWCGIRSCLQESGITFAGRSTHFAFGIDGGINTPVPPPPLGQGDTFKYTGRGEYDLTFDLEKFGGLPKGTLLFRMEHWYGEFGNVSLRSGALSPVVLPALLPPSPDDPGIPFMTNFLFTQPLTNTLAVFAGKGDGLGEFDQCVLASGNGTQQFVNQAFIANPAFLLAIPYTSFTTGATNVTEWGHTSLFIFDPQDRTRDFFRVGDLFSRGVIVGGEVQLNTNLFGLPGEQHVGAVWKHVNLNDLRFDEPPPGQFPYPTEPGFPTKSDSYTICYGFDQYLVQYADQPVRGWGLFGRASISDGNPTPLRSFLSAGIGGDSPLRRDRGDNWGIGWYFAGASNQFGPLPRTMFNPQDGTGVEMFYNFQVTPWLNVTPDIQFVRPEARAISADAFIYGLRVNMTL